MSTTITNSAGATNGAAVTGWDPIWEEVHRSCEWGQYPPEELIRFVARKFAKADDRGKVQLLELGCAVGANIWFLAREGYSAWGIEGS